MRPLEPAGLTLTLL